MEEMEETKQLVRHVDRRVRFLTWLCVVLFVALSASLIRGEFVNDAAHDATRAGNHAKAAAVEARNAARKASSDLADAIKTANAPQDPNGPIPTALREIHEIKILVQNLDSYVHNINGG